MGGVDGEDIGHAASSGLLASDGCRRHVSQHLVLEECWRAGEREMARPPTLVPSVPVVSLCLPALVDERVLGRKCFHDAPSIFAMDFRRWHAHAMEIRIEDRVPPVSTIFHARVDGFSLVSASMRVKIA